MFDPCFIRGLPRRCQLADLGFGVDPQFFELGGDILAVRAGLHRFINVQDLAVLAERHIPDATLDLAPGVTVGKLRHDGFLQGFGIKQGDPSIVCSQDTQGNQAKGQTAMENCLQRAPDINVVYTINEPAAAGAYQALKAAGKEKGVLIVSVDGGCAGVKNVKAGIIAATSQQYPLKMASLGVDAAVEYARTGKKAAGYVDTGVTLITDTPRSGVASQDTTFGMSACWGAK